MKFWLPFLVLVLMLSSKAFSSVKVAFFEGVDSRGQRIQLSPGDKYFHVAIQVDGVWYESLPGKVVTGMSKLPVYKNTILSLVLESNDIEVSREKIRRFIGWGFDHSFSWTKSGKTYCSRFVANLLGIDPSPMLFLGEHWRLSKGKRVGKLGISPDELLTALEDMNFNVIYDRHKGVFKSVSSKSCKSLL